MNNGTIEFFMNNFGIVFSVAWGSLVLKEERGRARALGALVIMAGIALIRFWG